MSIPELPNSRIPAFPHSRIPAFPHSRIRSRLGNLTNCRAVFALFIAAGLWLLLSPSVNAQVDPGILAGPIINPGNGHSYYLLSQDTWHNSESRAVALGGHLVTINDQAENDWVYNRFGDDGHFWIGLTDEVAEGNFQWISGQLIGYLNWFGGEPNNMGGIEDYTHVHSEPSHAILRTWNDASSTATLLGVVEVDDYPEPAFLRDGLVAYYPFNGNANDETGNGKNGQIIGNVTQAEDRFGRQSSAYQFDGVSSAIDVTQTVFNIGQAGYTISGWFCSDDVAARYQCILNSIPHNGFFIELNATGIPQLWYYIGPGDAPWTLTHGQGKGTKDNLSNQTWYHVTLTKNQTIYKFYLDGQVDFQTIIPSASTYNYDAGYRFGASTVSPGGFKGRWDDFRVYNRALSEAEVKGLYDYESKPSSGTATATPQVVNGFVVGVTVTYGGADYTEAPNVIISGGGGSGATATATISNGAVTAITINNPGSGYTGTPTVIIAPPPIPVRLATATLQVVNGFVVGATLTDKGSGYTNAPSVTITGGGGSGATAIANINRLNGEVTSITIQNTGSGYTGPTSITIASPPFPPRTATGASSLVNGFVVAATLTDGGFGYKTPPEVRLVGGGGSGATAVATVLDSIVNSIRIINPGIGYTSVPELRFGNPTHPLRAGVRLTPGIGNAAGKVRLTMDLMAGMRYQLESSPNLNTWTPAGAAIVAPEKTVSQEFDVNQVGQFFRIKQAP